VHQKLRSERFEQVLGNFIDINGYFRAGYGRDARGGPQIGFGAPGAPAKYRLGNEAENYGELIFGKSVYLPGAFGMNQELRPDGTPAGPVARVQVRLSVFNPYSSGNATFGLPEAWASIGNVFSAMPSAKFWAGKRFYRRHDIHINDFFFWDVSGGGGGVEDIELGPVKLALAWIGIGSTSGIGNVPQPDPTNAAGFSKSNYDLRVYDVPLLGGNLEFGATLASVRSGFDSAGQKAQSRTGVGFTVVHTVNKFINEFGTNKLSLQYGIGPAKNFSSAFETFTLPAGPLTPGGTFIRTEEKGAWRARATEHFIAQFGEHFSLAPVVIFQATDHQDGTGRKYWASGGARPTAHINRYFSVAAEGGVDWVKDTGPDTSGVLGKVTLAPQVAVANRFDSRPVIRLFCTAAFWSDDFEGQVGGPDYATSQRGLSAGAQMEAWW